MLRLILLRHAKAAPSADGGDAERPLTPQGRRDAARVGDYLAGHSLFPDLAIVSTARRARETLDLAIDTFGEPCPVLAESRLYLAEPPALLEVVRHMAPGVRLLLAVGHNPGFHDLALMLTGAGERGARGRLAQGFPTAAFAVIDFRASSWLDVAEGAGALERFLAPEDLRF